MDLVQVSAVDDLLGPSHGGDFVETGEDSDEAAKCRNVLFGQASIQYSPLFLGHLVEADFILPVVRRVTVEVAARAVIVQSFVRVATQTVSASVRSPARGECIDNTSPFLFRERGCQPH